MPRALHARLRDSAQRDPDRLAFVKGERRTTYGELDRQSSRFAAALRALGVNRGDCVGLVLDGDVDYLVASYAVLKAGAAVVPLCADARTNSLCSTLARCHAKAVIMDGRQTPLLAGRLTELTNLRSVVHRGPATASDGDGRWQPYEPLLEGRQELHDDGACDEDLAYVVYTSGTTGLPKGVMLPHRSIDANVASIVEYLQLVGADVVGMTLPFYYVYGNSVLHTHVAAGATIAQIGSMTFPEQVLRGLVERGCTGFSGVPSTFARLLAMPTLADHDLSKLRYVTQAGAAMSREMTSMLARTMPHAKVFVMYGQTEASARLAYLPPEDLERKLGSVGKAIPGMQLRVANPEGGDASAGVVGEVIARGDSVMAGYLDDPAATAQVLRSDGLHTGDLGYLDAEGYLYLVGRQSEMIKSGAHRISPMEIEAELLKVDGVRECAVAGVPDALLGEAIAAFVVPRDDAALDRKAVLRTCNEQLPRFKLPQHVVKIDALPRGDSGKLERRVLRQWFAEGRGEVL